MEEKKSIFRKSVLDRISTPEDLDKYLSVTGPGIWFPLIAVVVLLLGVFAWMIFGRLDTTINVAVVSDGEAAVCYLPYEAADQAVTASVTIAGTEYALRDDGLAVQLISDSNLSLAAGLPEGSPVKPVHVDAELTEGTYEGTIVVETVNPIKFITN